MRYPLLTLLAVAGLATPALAQDNTTTLPPAGQTFFDISVSEHESLPQDTLGAELRYELDGTSANDIQDRINKNMAAALAEARKVTSVKTSTDNYNVYMYDTGETTDPRTGQPVKTAKKWRGAQSIRLESTDSTKLLELAGKIQSMGFVMNGLTYSLSREKSDSVGDELMTRALKSLGQKAKLAASALGKNTYDIVSVTVNNAAPPPPYVMARAMAKSAAIEGMAAPVAQASETDVTLTLNARILLKP